MNSFSSLGGAEAGALASFLSSCTWAIGATAYSAFSKRYTSPAVNLCRTMIALPMFFLTLYLLSDSLAGATAQVMALHGRHWAWFLASVVGSFALGDTLFLLSTQILGVPAALAVASTYPLWAALGGWLFLGNPLAPLAAAGALFVVGGTVVVILSGRKKVKAEDAIPARRYWLGVTFAVLTSLFWALNSFSLAVAGQGMSPVLANVVRALLSLALCPLVGLLLYRRNFRLIPIRSLGNYFWIFLLEAYAGSLFFIYGLGHSPLVVASVLSSLAPIIALVLAWAWRREAVSLRASLAIAVVVAGIWLLASAH